MMEYGDGQERVIVWFLKALLVAGLLVGVVAIALMVAAAGGG